MSILICSLKRNSKLKSLIQNPIIIQKIHNYNTINSLLKKNVPKSKNITTTSSNPINIQKLKETIPNSIKKTSLKLNSSFKYIKNKTNIIYEKLQKSSGISRAATLQLTAFWQNYGNIVLGITGLIFGYLIWKLSHGLLMLFSKTSSNAIANFGSLMLAVTLISAAYFYLKHRFAVDPEIVYRLALLKLNTHPGILDVMGAPLVGSELRVLSISKSKLKFEDMKFKYFSKHIRMMFPLAGSERRGLVFLEATKLRGKYDLRVLGVDVPLENDQEERVYILGDSSLYNQGGILASLREPLIKTHLSDALDTKADMIRNAKIKKEEEEKEEILEETKKDDDVEGLYLHEKIYWRTRELKDKLKTKMKDIKLYSYLYLK